MKQIKYMIIWGISAMCAALALTMNYALPDMKINEVQNEIFTNLKLSMPENLFLVSVLTILFYVVCQNIYTINTSISFRILCLFLSVICVMSYSLSIDDSLSTIYHTKGQIVKSLIMVIGMNFGFYISGKWLYQIIKNEADKVEEGYTNNKSVWIKDMSLILLLWIPHIVLAYPATMDTDTWAQVEMFYGCRTFTDHFTTTHTWLLGIITLIGKFLHNGNIGLFIYILMQSLIFSMLLAYEIYRMRELKVPKWLLNITYLVAIFSPYYVSFIGWVLRDVIYAYFIFLFVIEWIFFIRDEHRFWHSKWHILLWMISVFCSISFRKNGKYVIYPVIMIAVILTLKNAGWKFSKKISVKMILLIMPAIVAVMLTNGLNAYYGVEKSSISEALSLPFQQTARYVKEYEGEVTESERNDIEKVLRYEILAKVYDPIKSDAVKGTFGFYSQPSLKDFISYFKVWLKQFLKHPICYVSATLNQNYQLFCPFTRSETIRLSTLAGINKNEINDILGVHEVRTIEILSEGLENYYTFMYRMPILQLFSNLSVYVYLLIFLFAYAVFHRVRKACIAMIPMVMCVFIVLLAPCVGVRYALPFVYPMPIMVAYFIDALRTK